MEFFVNGERVEVVDESPYSLCSADEHRRYGKEFHLGECEHHASSRHGIVIDGEPFAVFDAAGGATGVHPHSALLLGSDLFLAVSAHVVCVALDARELRWDLEIDEATCCGLHYQDERKALISHGEIEIARFSECGQVLWRTSGADIFSEGFELTAGFVQAVDFNGTVYRFDYDSGQEWNAEAPDAFSRS